MSHFHNRCTSHTQYVHKIEIDRERTERNITLYCGGYILIDYIKPEEDDDFFNDDPDRHAPAAA